MRHLRYSFGVVVSLLATILGIVGFACDLASSCLWQLAADYMDSAED